MLPTITRVPDVTDAFSDLLAANLTGVTVLDGPRAAQELHDDVLQVGVGNSENARAYESVQTVEGYGNRPKEAATIHCELSTWSGSQDAQARPLRRRIGTLLGQIDTLLRAHSTMSGACDRIYLGQHTRWYALQSEDGPGLGVEFAVTFEAWL